MKKKNKTIGISILSVLALVGLGACSSDHGKSYLEDKYDDDFTYIGNGDDLWSDKQTTSIYEDKNGKEFSVEEYRGDYIDNYSSVLYDGEIQAELQALYGNDYKVFFSSVGAFFSENRHFDSSNDYLKSCSPVSVEIVVQQAKDYDEIVETLLRYINDTQSMNTYYSAVIYDLNANAYDNISSYGDEILPSDIESYGSFSIKNGQIEDKSWE